MTDQKTLIIGIDPGFSGAIAVFDREKKVLLDVFDMPSLDPKAFTAWRSTGNSDRIQFDVAKIAEFFLKLAPRTALVCLEKVHSHPNMGVSGCFRFGEGFGILRGAAAAAHLRVQMVEPTVWKMSLGLSSNKKESRDMATVHFPQFKEFFAHKRDDGRAEAALLAEFGTRFLAAEPDPVIQDPETRVHPIYKKKIREKRVEMAASKKALEELF